MKKSLRVCSTVEQQRPSERFARQLSARGKSWDNGDTIDIHFKDGTDNMKRLVKTWSEEWLQHANLKFRWGVSRNNSDIRISFSKSGAYSYIGTDATRIDNRDETMNFGWVDRATVLHEFGHMLGLKHEHQHPEKPFNWNTDTIIHDMTGPPNSWTIEQIQWNILKTANPENTDLSPFDKNSIMLYFFPGTWTTDGRGTKQNQTLSEQDKAYMRKLYPFPKLEPKDYIDALALVYGSREVGNLYTSTHREVAKKIGIIKLPSRERDMIITISKHIKKQQMR